ncbi:unnamed protein product [Discula destructiva]
MDVLTLISHFPGLFNALSFSIFLFNSLRCRRLRLSAPPQRLRTIHLSPLRSSYSDARDPILENYFLRDTSLNVIAAVCSEAGHTGIPLDLQHGSYEDRELHRRSTANLDG